MGPRLALALLAVAFLACPPGPGSIDGGQGGGGGGAGGPGGSGVGANNPFDAGPEPTSPIRPVPGELTILQLDLPAGLIPAIGEAAIVIGPDGTTVLIDVGNNSHDDDVRGALFALNTLHLIPAKRFSARDALYVDWIVLTHFHSDHIGATRSGVLGSQRRRDRPDHPARRRLSRAGRGSAAHLPRLPIRLSMSKLSASMNRVFSRRVAESPVSLL